jgi:hypothetical protein
LALLPQIGGILLMVGNLPVQQPIKFELVINPRTPKDTGPDSGHGGEVLMTSCFVL